MEQPKSIWASKTLWTNVIALIAIVGGAFVPALQEALDAEAQGTIAAGILAVVNIILRLVTTKPLTLQKRDMVE